MRSLDKIITAGFLFSSLSGAAWAQVGLTAPTWSPKAAAAYLDERSSWWMAWPKASRDHGTFCVSCHTLAPYALGRPALRAALAETAPSANENKMLENITRRVRIWKEAEPFYADQTSGLPKSSESPRYGSDPERPDFGMARHAFRPLERGCAPRPR